MVRGSLAGRVGAVRGVFGRFGEEAVPVGYSPAFVAVGVSVGFREFQGPVHLVGGYVVEPFPLVVSVPVLFGRLKQRKRSHHVGPGERERVFDRPVHMAFGGEVDHSVDVVVAEYLPHLFVIADVRFDERVVRRTLDVREVGQIARIGQFVEVDDAVAGVFVYEQADHVASDEAGTAGNQDVVAHK